MNALLIKYDRCLWFVILPYFPVEQQKRRPVKSAILIDYNQFNSLIIRWLLADAKVLEDVSQHLVRLDGAAHNLAQVVEALT